MVSANGIHLPRTRPHGRSLGKPQEPLGPDPGISRGLLRGPGALSDPGSARPDPRITAGHLHSAMSGLRPPWGWDTWGRGASNRPTWRETRRPLRLVPTTVKIPPVLPSVKGDPFTDGRTGGRPPGDGFPPSRGCLVWGPEAGPRMRGQAPSPQACLRAMGPALEISCQVHRVPGVVSGETEVLPATQRTPRFLLDPTSQQLSNPGRGRVPREDLGT